MAAPEQAEKQPAGLNFTDGTPVPQATDIYLADMAAATADAIAEGYRDRDTAHVDAYKVGLKLALEQPPLTSNDVSINQTQTTHRTPSVGVGAHTYYLTADVTAFRDNRSVTNATLVLMRQTGSEPSQKDKAVSKLELNRRSSGRDAVHFFDGRNRDVALDHMAPGVTQMKRDTRTVIREMARVLTPAAPAPAIRRG